MRTSIATLFSLVLGTLGAQSAAGQVVGSDAYAARPALVLSNGTAVGVGSNVAATAEAGEPEHMAQPPARSLWWKWTAPATGVAEVDTVGTNFSTRLVVYTGALVPLAGNVSDLGSPGFESVVRFQAVGGVTYSIVVDGYIEGVAETGSIVLNLAQPVADPPPANDSFGTPTELGNGSTVTASGDSSSASVEELEPDAEVTFFPTGPGRSVWYTWTAPATGWVTVEVDGGSGQWEPALGVYQGSSLAALTEVDKGELLSFVPGEYTNEIVMATFPATVGQSYRIVVAARSFIASHGTFNLILRPATRPPNDDLTNAADLGSATTAVGGGTLFEATLEAGEPNHFSGVGSSEAYSSASIWWKWTAPTAGTYTADTRASDGDTILAIYRTAALLFVAAGDDINFDADIYSSVVTFTATAGTVYYFAVSGYSLSSSVRIHVAAGPPRLPFEAWLLDFPSLTGADATRGADPDRDGFSNLTELMLGTDPTRSSPGDPVDDGLLPATSIEDGWLYLDVGRHMDNLNGLSDGTGSGGLPIIVTAEKSADLKLWTEVPPSGVEFNSLTAAAFIPAPGPDRFLRFRVNDPNP